MRATAPQRGHGYVGPVKRGGILSLPDAERPSHRYERPKRQDSDGERQPVTPERWTVRSH